MKKNVMVETSARHLHVSQADLETLFGKGAVLTSKKALSQPGQFACEEKVRVVGPRGEFNMTILGPVRPDTQVEISMSDARKIGIYAPIRESGDIAGTPGCKLIGPKGEVEIDKGVIVAKRHMHLDPKTAEEFGVNDKQVVSLRLGENDRKLVFDDVVVRVNKNFSPAVHLDTDEANAAGIMGETKGEIIA